MYCNIYIIGCFHTSFSIYAHKRKKRTTSLKQMLSFRCFSESVYFFAWISIPTDNVSKEIRPSAKIGQGNLQLKRYPHPDGQIQPEGILCIDNLQPPGHNLRQAMADKQKRRTNVTRLSELGHFSGLGHRYSCLFFIISR